MLTLAFELVQFILHAFCYKLSLKRGDNLGDHLQ